MLERSPCLLSRALLYDVIPAWLRVTFELLDLLAITDRLNPFCSIHRVGEIGPTTLHCYARSTLISQDLTAYSLAFSITRQLEVTRDGNSSLHVAELI